MRMDFLSSEVAVVREGRIGILSSGCTQPVRAFFLIREECNVGEASKEEAGS